MEKIYAHIPARAGSERIKLKNLKLINKRPLICHMIRAAQGCKELSRTYLNTESDEIGKVGEECGIEVFKRDSNLAVSSVTQDAFNYDFIKKTSPDILVLLNPVCPLVEAEDIDRAINLFKTNNADTLLSVTTYKQHALMGHKAINFSLNSHLPRTQDISPITVINWAIGIWKAEHFIRFYEKNGHATMFGKIVYFELPKEKAIKISDDEDFYFAEKLLKLRELGA